MEINKDNWKQIDLNVDSLWLIPERDRQGKHNNIYHGNFAGSGTTLFAYENLRKDYIGFAPPKKLSIMSIAL